MSISLNDHENRITTLEKQSGRMKSEMLFNGSSNANQITLSKSINLFDAVVVHHSMSPSGNVGIGDTLFIPHELYNVNLDSEFAREIGQTTIKVHDTKFIFVENWYTGTKPKNSYLKYVVGLKWGGGINFGTLFKRFLVYIKTYSNLFHFHLSEVK